MTQKLDVSSFHLFMMANFSDKEVQFAFRKEPMPLIRLFFGYPMYFVKLVVKILLTARTVGFKQFIEKSLCPFSVFWGTDRNVAFDKTLFLLLFPSTNNTHSFNLKKRV